MNYIEYNNEYLKVIAKQSLKMSTQIKMNLINSINITNNLNWLEQFLTNTNFESFIARDEIQLQELERIGKADEFRELIEQDIDTTIFLKEAAENRLKELKEQDKETKELGDDKEDHQQIKGLEDEKEKQAVQSGTGKTGKKSLNNNLEYDQETQHIYIRDIMSMIKREGNTLALLKGSVISSINIMQDTRSSIEKSPIPETLEFLSNFRELYGRQTKQIAKSYMDMSECDEELRMLCEQMVIAGQQVNETVDRHIAKYRAGKKENSTDEDKDRIQEEERAEQGGENDKKSWYIPPEQKKTIQNNTRQISQKHIEEQSVPQQQKEDSLEEQEQ